MSITHLRENDSGRAVQMHVGDRVTIELKENASTGFAWDIATLDQTALESFRPENESPGQPMPGAAGKFRLSLIATKPGEFPVHLKQWRPWEGEQSAVSRFEVVIKVSAN